MAQSGHTPIILYSSTNAGNTPAAADLATGELALNAADGKLFYKNSVTNNVTTLAGLSGYSGTNGASGISGYSGSGISGYSGISGFSGYSGSGVSGYSGYSGYSGSGVSGYSGYSGSGISGYSGYSGINGSNGSSGISGYSGYSGSGISGYSGYSGIATSGFSGYSGISGYSGFASTSGNYQIGSLGVGTPASGTSGEIRATNNVTAFYSSDRQFKENIEDIPNALEIVDAIGGKLFDWTDAYLNAHGGEDDYFVHKHDFGVIAQDVQAVFPRAVRIRPDGSLAVDYDKLIALAFAAIKELKKELNK